jgi:DNA-binding XRE family transcriptional regulator
MITAAQTRAARAWLDMRQSDLASKAEVGLSTLRAFEAGQRAPIRANLAALRTTLESAGIRFVFSDDGKAAGIAVDDARPGKVSGTSDVSVEDVP